MQTFVDIHSHLLYGVDDGALDQNVSLELIRIGRDDGITDFILTPHLDYYNPALNAQIVLNFSRLTELAAGSFSDVRLHLGGEIHYTYDLFRFADEKTGLFGRSKQCLLLEFDFEHYPPAAQQVVDKLIKNSLQVIIAHPERIYPLAANHQALKLLQQSGCRFQITAGSLLGYFGRDVEKSAWRLLGQGFADFVASDAHHPVKRPFWMRQAFQKVEQKYGAESAQKLFCQNQQEIIL